MSRQQQPAKSVYLDYNATSPMSPESRDAVIEAMYNGWQNPSICSRTRAIVQTARQSVADLIGCQSDELIFTSGGTESDNWAVKQAVRMYRNLVQTEDATVRPHIVASCIEHDAILKPIQRLVDLGRVDVTWLRIDPSSGALANVDELISALRWGSTCLVTVMWANNETGALFPIHEIASALSNWRLQNTHRQQNSSNSSLTSYAKCGLPLFHTDACQAIGKVPVNVAIDGLDLLSLAGHKFQGPRGVGALYCSARLRPYLAPMLLGGGQEAGLRAGTENTPGLAGLGAAARLAKSRLEDDRLPLTEQLTVMRNQLRDRLLESVNNPETVNATGFRLIVNNNFPAGSTLPNTLNVSIVSSNYNFTQSLSASEPVGKQTSATNYEAALARNFLLSRGRLLASAGSACHAAVCSSGPSAPASAVLLKSGVHAEAAAAALRLSVGPDTSLTDIQFAVEEVGDALRQWRLDHPV